MVTTKEDGGQTGDARLREFKAALVLAGMTQGEWAKANGVTYTHLFYVLRGDRQSPRLDKALAEFTRKHLPRKTRTAAAAAA